MNKIIKNRMLALTGLTFLSVSLVGLSAKADNTMQIVELIKVDVQKLSTGYRASKTIGDSVVNDANETIGKVDDLIISPDDNKSAYAILSVGGWLGMGTHLIALPYDDLRISNSRVLLPGVTREALKNLPEFKYNKQ